MKKCNKSLETPKIATDVLSLLRKVPATIPKDKNLKDIDRNIQVFTLIVEPGAGMATLKRLCGWKSGSVIEVYLEGSISSKNKVSKLLALESLHHQTSHVYI